MSSSKKTDDPHDKRLKELFGNKEAFISFLKDCVKADWINDLDEDSLKPSNHSFILQDFKKREADVVYEATLKGGKEKVIFYILLENQRKVDFRMPYRLLLYIVEILRHYYNQSDVKARRRKEFKFPAVVPIVFFNGSEKWTVPLNLKDMFYGHERFGGNLINFNYALVDTKGYDDESVKDFRSRLLKVMMMFEKSKDLAELGETIEKYKSEIVKLNDEEFRIISAAFEILSKLYGNNETYDLNEIIQAKNAGRVDSMLSDILTNPRKYERNLIKKAKKEATAEAKKKALEEKRELAKNLLDVLDVETIAKKLNLTVEEVEKLKSTL